jgi:hypothetical protein
MLTLLAQSAAEAERARYLEGVRFFWFLVTVVLILTIVLLLKKIFKK